MNNLFIFYPKLEDVFRFQIILDVLRGKESGIGWEILTLNEYVIEINIRQIIELNQELGQKLI